VGILCEIEVLDSRFHGNDRIFLLLNSPIL